MDKYVIVIEPGSSKIRGAIASVNPSGAVTVRAVEEEKLVDSVIHGIVRNVAQVAASIDNVLKKLVNSQGGGRVTGVYVALGGRSTAVTPIRTEQRLSTDTEITDAILAQLERDARATRLPERDVVGVTPREFFVDNQRTANPVGSIAREVRATYNVINCRQHLLRNLNHVFEKTLRLPVRGYFVRQLCEADLVLTPEERRIGVMLVDFGAETTTVSIYRQGALVHLATLPMGSRNVTRDIASVTHLEEMAERIKLSGEATGDRADEIFDLVDARVGEIVANIAEQVKQAGLTAADLPGGIVTVGGGGRLRGFSQRLSQCAKMTVRVGQPGANVRIGEPSVRPSEAVDVIAVAVAAAPQAENCFEEYVETIAPGDEDRDAETTNPAPAGDPGLETIGTAAGRRKTPVYGDGNDTSEPESGTPRRWGFWKRTKDIIRTGTINLINENDDDDDDTLRDDE